MGLSIPGTTIDDSRLLVLSGGASFSSQHRWGGDNRAKSARSHSFGLDEHSPGALKCVIRLFHQNHTCC
jgi:hypothetical protein